MPVACDNLVKKKISNLFIGFFAKIKLLLILKKISKFFNNFFAIIKIRIIRVKFQNPCFFMGDLIIISYFFLLLFCYFYHFSLSQDENPSMYHFLLKKTPKMQLIYDLLNKKYMKTDLLFI